MLFLTRTGRSGAVQPSSLTGAGSKTNSQQFLIKSAVHLRSIWSITSGYTVEKRLIHKAALNHFRCHVHGFHLQVKLMCSLFRPVVAAIGGCGGLSWVKHMSCAEVQAGTFFSVHTHCPISGQELSLCAVASWLTPPLAELKSRFLNHHKDVIGWGET